MLYFVGGAPRAGKSILGQQVAAQLQTSWISTDLLADLLRVKGDDGPPHEWNAAPEAIMATAAWFYPYLERFAWGISSATEYYVVDGVSFLPAQLAQLSHKHSLRAVFLGCTSMTRERFDQFPGRSPGYAFLPEAMRRQIVDDVPRWSEFIRQEAERYGYPYVDMGDDFPARLRQAEALLTGTDTAAAASAP